jgi:hypothetical protein
MLPAHHMFAPITSNCFSTLLHNDILFCSTHSKFLHTSFVFLLSCSFCFNEQGLITLFFLFNCFLTLASTITAVELIQNACATVLLFYVSSLFLVLFNSQSFTLFFLSFSLNYLGFSVSFSFCFSLSYTFLSFATSFKYSI